MGENSWFGNFIRGLDCIEDEVGQVFKFKGVVKIEGRERPHPPRQRCGICGLDICDCFRPKPPGPPHRPHPPRERELECECECRCREHHEHHR